MSDIVWTDEGLANITYLQECVTLEAILQKDKWGIQSRSPFEWMVYLMEEVGELSEAVSEKVYRKGRNIYIRNEAIQVATLALKIAEMAQGDSDE